MLFLLLALWITGTQFHPQDINKKMPGVYDPPVIDISFNKSAIMNDMETVNMINASVDLVPERILLAAHPLVDDPDAALKEMQKQREEKAAAARKAMGTYGLAPGEDNQDDPDSKDDDE